MLRKFTLFISNIMEKPLPIDEVIADRYKVVEYLGSGSYGHSYLVFDFLSKQNKVLKSLRYHKRIIQTGRKGFELEKELLRSINHPGFPKYFEDGTFKNIPYYTMEYINGKNFEQLIFHEGKKFTETEVFKFADELLQYIEFLHSHHIIHRDIRIPNVIFDGSRIRLIDLGLGRYLKPKDGDPQNIEDVRKQINYQADFYGLGHFLLFLLYSNFTFDDNRKEKSWEEELDITVEAKQIIRRLLQIESAYDQCAQIRADIKNFT
ncbi:protein kinase [Neobacillus rhizosphaerae]|uniref:serine/threonine protein kinase n=1 Tax=Neobacillus rhizosphaerae TaxID=2880965 RepID=UPI003D2CCD78